MTRTPIAYKQADPLWGSDLLGCSPTSTMGGYGCMVATVASLAPLAGLVISPGELNALGRKHGAFVAGTGKGKLEKLAALAGLVAPEHLRIRDHDPRDPVDHARMVEVIRRSLAGPDVADGYFTEPGACVINVDHNGDDTPDHFLALVAEASEGWAGLDPAPGRGVPIPRSLAGFRVRWSPTKQKTYTVIGIAPIGGKLR